MLNMLHARLRVALLFRPLIATFAGLAVVAALLSPAAVVLAQSRDGASGAGTLMGRAALEAAQQEIDRGRVLDARRILKSTIESDPNSWFADEARRMLSPIYSTSIRNNGDPGVRQAQSPSRQDQPSVPDSSALRGVAQPGVSSAQLGNTQVGANVRRSFDSRQLRFIVQDYRNTVADRVFFGNSSIEIGSRARRVLASQAAWFKRHPSMLALIEAHADDRGSTEFNSDISRRRADAVQARLVEEGVEAERIRISVRGRESPIAACGEAACAAQNRRVVTIVGDPALERSLPAASGPRIGR